MTTRLQPHQLESLRLHGEPPPGPKVRKKRDNRESRLQKSIIRWWDASCQSFGVHKWMLHSIPNGAVYGVGQERIIRASILKDEGLRPGYPDLGLDVARKRCHGLRIEVKIEDTKPDETQLEYHHQLIREGYCVRVVRSLDEAVSTIKEYLS